MLQTVAIAKAHYARVLLERPPQKPALDRSIITTMVTLPISTWSGRRVLMLWIGGLSLQAALIIVPVWRAVRNAPQARAQWNALSERWSVAERADSISVAAQRASGASGVAPTGDSVYAVVRMPSSRPKKASIKAARPLWFPLLEATYLWGIPIALLVLTARWQWRRGARDGDGQSPPRAGTV